MQLRLLLVLVICALLAGCISKPVPSPDFPEGAWNDYNQAVDPYILWTGDTLDIAVTTAPELSRQGVVIAPDGSVQIPFIGRLQAAGRTVNSLQGVISLGLQSELRDPRVFVAATDFGSQQIFVNGQVNQPGIYQLPGQIGPLQAIAMAGGTLGSANTKQVILMRRLPGGEVKSAVYNIKKGVLDPRAADWGPLQRFDVIHVNATWIAQQNQFVQEYIRNALPVDFSLVFDLANSGIL